MAELFRHYRLLRLQLELKEVVKQVSICRASLAEILLDLYYQGAYKPFRLHVTTGCWVAVGRPNFKSPTMMLGLLAWKAAHFAQPVRPVKPHDSPGSASLV